MNFFEKIFGGSELPKQPDIRFGRYSDIYHTASQDEAFDRAVRDFEDEKYLSAYRAFFYYLQNEEEGNVRVWDEGGEVRFELLQGSKKVVGYGNEKKLHAEAKVARANKLKASFMRRLLDENHELKYSRFTLNDDDEITIVFDTYTIDGSPFKLYAALKELATHADKQDDILIDEFKPLKQIERNVKREIPEQEKEIKYRYIVSQIQAAFDEIDKGKLNIAKYPVAITYLLLYLCYKLDYLTKPEGYMMEALERIHRLAFAQDGKNAAQKNQVLRKEFQKLLDRPKEKFFAEMYEVRATFGITAPIDHQKVGLIIEQELANMKWYQEQGHKTIALAIPGFIAGRCLFYFAVPKPDKELFHFLLEILEADYFRQLGFHVYNNNGKLDQRGIKRRIREIADRCETCHPNLSPNLKKLNFNSLPEFAESYCWMIKELDLTGN
ncbi:MAG TPA: hypothetical protein ENJ95_09595 [Bacteroidetes bacterium]|nr:hypothetical protein [Bacteroidota bacterium]